MKKRYTNKIGFITELDDGLDTSAVFYDTDEQLVQLIIGVVWTRQSVFLNGNCAIRFTSV